MMSRIVRIDVDKPYGRKTILQKILSKLTEDYYFPKLSIIGYLNHFYLLLNDLKSYDVKAYIYFRVCTFPKKKMLKKILNDGHKIGIHIENSKNEETFLKELSLFNKHFGFSPHSFTKHGSGSLKLGKNHYPKYEENKYLVWSKKYNIPFLFGNGSFQSNITYAKSDFYPDMFWINPTHRDTEKHPVTKYSSLVNEGKIPVIIHPSNYYNKSTVFIEFNKLLNGNRFRANQYFIKQQSD